MQQLKDRGENIPPEDIKEVAKEIKVGDEEKRSENN